MEYIKAIILGIVQGLTEFLPVSSSGHLVFLQLVGVGEPSLFFNIMLHLGTLIAAAIALWRPIFDTLKSFDKVLKVLISSIPTFVIAALAKFFFEDALEGAILGVGFLITAVVLVLTESLKKPNQDEAITNKKAMFVGVMQGLAVLPGVSRSGMTVGFLRGTGVDGKSAAQYSFIIGMPVILGGAMLEIYQAFQAGTSGEWSVTAIILGVITAFLSGFLAIKVMLTFLARKSLLPFAVYVTLLAIISFIV